MNGPVREAGTAVLADGSRLVWSVADGRRGRRWRAISTRHGVLRQVLLLETGPDGRPTRLELATPDGLLTLHPEADGTSLHGNVVTRDAVRHLSFGWSAAHGLAIEGQPIADAVIARRLAGSLAVGEGSSLPVVVVAQDLAAGEETWSVRRLSRGDWRIEAGEDRPGAPTRSLSIDEQGLPASLGAAMHWPLELDPER